MSNTSNYIQATECLQLQHISTNNQKIKIEDYFLSNPTQVDRQRHLDLTTECIPYRLPKDSKFRKKGDIASPVTSIGHARKELLEYFNIDENFNNGNIHTCHKCIHNSTNKEFVCINPLHLYIGTVSENHHDIDPEIRKQIKKKGNQIGSSKGGQIGGKASSAKQLADGTHAFLDPNVCSKAGQIGGPKGAAKGIANGTHVMLQNVQCPHSSHITKLHKIRGYIKHHFPHLKQWDEYTKDEQKSFYR